MSPVLPLNRMSQSGQPEKVQDATESPVLWEAFKPLKRIRPYPAYALSGLFGIASFIPYTVFPHNTFIAPFLHRVGFAAVLGGAGYAISTGDVRNGSGIATAWSLTYLFLNLRRSLKAPRNLLSLAMAGGAAASAGVYGTEYFVFQS